LLIVLNARMRSRGAIIAIVAVPVLTLAGVRAASASADCVRDLDIPTAATASQAAATMVCDINAVRAGYGLSALRLDPRLRFVATALVTDMARSGNLSHVDSEGRDLTARVAFTGYLRRTPRRLVFENIAWADGSLAAPRSILDDWMASAEHREKLLDPSVTTIGVAVFAGDGAYFAADFGSG
jgi:uncharacterized protein YkwD